jgi:hypothetical protein
MKQIFLLIAGVCITFLLNAQVTKTVNIAAGGLFSALTASEQNTITKIIITGTIDARDFKTMRDNMPLLALLDISGATIAAYSGTGGTYYNGSNYDYPANEIPYCAFYYQWAPVFAKTSLTSVQLPVSLVAFGTQAFQGCTGLTAVTIPASVTSIESYAFQGCTGLTSVIFSTPSSVTSIGYSAFQGCTGLISVTIPTSVATIEDNAFQGCTGLTSLNFSSPSSLTSIGDWAFQSCTELTTLDFPSSLLSIGTYSFYNCTKLSSVSLPLPVTSIGTYAFYYCSALASITAFPPVPVNLVSSSEVFSGVNKGTCVLNVPFESKTLYSAANQWKDFTNIKEMPGFRLSGTEYTLAAAAGSAASVNVTSDVNWTASSSQSWLTPTPVSGSGTKTLTLTAQANTSVATRIAKVSISAVNVVSQTITITQVGVPKTLTIEAGGLFSALTALERSTITRLVLTGTIDARDFKTMRDNMPLLALLDISGATIAAYSGTGGTYYNGSNYDYPANEIPYCAFYYQWAPVFAKTSLISVMLPESLVSVGDYAFQACTGLASVTIPTSVVTIEDNAFQGCTGLTSLNFSTPSSLTSIGNNTFQGCTGLTTLNFPSSLLSIGTYSFYNCTKLSSVSLPLPVTSIGTYAFYYCSALASINAYPPVPVNLVSSSGVFSGVNKGTCVLNVPFESKTLYSAANQWKDFTNIIELPGFRLSGTEYTLAAAAGSAASVNVTSDVTWTASSNQSWLTPTPVSGSGTGTLTLTAQANTSVATRIAKVTISAANVVSQTITITQVGVPKTLTIEAGGLFSALTALERSTITRLVITGTIDARDFKTMRDDMPVLAQLDISGATIAAYNGTAGTYYVGNNYDYKANEIPYCAFYYQWAPVFAKTSLISVMLPESLVSVGDYAFQACTGLASVTISYLGCYY